MSRISIIEDDQLIAQMYRMKLEGDGYTVDVAENGMNGIRMVQQTKPDLILLDYSLPDITGAAVLAEVRKASDSKGTPVIVLTNMESDAVREELKQWNIADYIVKVDLTPSQVVERIKKALA